ncbi:MAG TPA: MBL fold metallo-hydrolase [Gammaproteobacteria bacterium]|jgi:glyoxylase-like metal-dependent hydrolase (beta-lactamase superfamily II)|nr:MBL fold metallo-hydrolase [Gammaproteobacteria bacterium]HIN90780.1 MBL fold metallo-hydrolase [Porticoccaceae bacterium]
MKRIILVTALVAVSIAVISLTSAQQRPTMTPEQLQRVQIRPVPGKDGLYVIPGFDGNMSGGSIAVLVTGEGVIIVDNKFSDSFSDIVRQVASVTSEPIRYVLNTHHHFDHAGSNADFIPTAQVIGHENARANMIRNGETGAPPLTFSQRTSVYLGDAEVQAHHFGRGHTGGDAVIYFPAQRTVHTGDLFIWGDRLDGSTLAPFIDYSNGGSAADWTATLDGVLTLEFDTVIPGHGPLLTKSDIRTFQDKFDRLVMRITRLMESGVSRNDIAEALIIEDLNWPLAPDRIEAIFDELAQ